MNNDNINNYLPSILNPRAVRKQNDLSLTQNSIVSRCSRLSLKRPNGLSTAKPLNKVAPKNKENSQHFQNTFQETQRYNNVPTIKQDVADDGSLGFSAIEDLQTTKEFSPISACDIDFTKNYTPDELLVKNEEIVDNQSDRSYKAISSATELDNAEAQSVSTIIYGVNKPTVQVSFGVINSKSVHVTAKNVTIKRFCVTHENKSTNVDCEVIEHSQLSTNSELDENMNETYLCPLKRTAVAVSLEIKKQKLTHNGTESSKVLILNTNATEKISHVIVQPPNYKFVKRNISNKSKYRNGKSDLGNGNRNGTRLNQVAIESFFRKATDVNIDVSRQLGRVSNDDAANMSKNLGVDGAKCERSKTAKSIRRSIHESPRSARLPKRDITPPKRQAVNICSSDAPSSRVRNETMSAHSPGKRVESNSIHFSLPAKTRSNKVSVPPKSIPHHKIITGTHFAVDAFSYGDIEGIKNYFLTHFHSDHYSGLKKTFSKILFCSKITADLCISRLGVNHKNIRILNVDEVIWIDGVEVAAVDANHCPGALMLVFTLPNGKTLLHTGDFRAYPSMESYPLFWNKDIHTVYLDTTYCNPRYDFPTQDQSLEMALYILRQKKMSLEKFGKKFSSVLIVCGTYTIGKEKFFLGISRRVGCSVWACPEKERVLHVVEGRSAPREPPPPPPPPHACQLHVVPMRDLTHEKLRSYLDSLQGAFSEVVAFKPSGWENGKNPSVEKDLVTIHGIPYSEHSSFSELVRFVKFLKPKQVVPTVDISGGVKAVQKYFPCPIVYKDEIQCQTNITDYFSIQNRQKVTAVT